MRLVVTGGGTGGHVYPIVAVMQALRSSESDLEVMWIGSGRGPEKIEAERQQVIFKSVATGKVRRYFSINNVLDIFKIPFGVLQAWFLLGSFKPDVVFAKGGFVSYPVVFAAWLRDIPILLHETDSVPGLANRRLAKKATLIALSFPIAPPELPKGKTVYVGQPIRLDVLTGNAKIARERFELTADDRLVLAVFGGSQGAQSINKVIARLLPELLPHYQVVHQVGPDNADFGRELQEKYGERGYRASGFFTDGMRHVYALADVIVSRAGGMVHEYAALGKPIVLLPLPGSASNHQVRNAQAFAKQRAAIVLEEPNIKPSLLLQTLLKLRHDAEERKRLGTAIKRLDEPQAAEKLAHWISRLSELR